MSNIKRVSMVMHLKPGNAEEYKRRHDEIWPELSALLRGASISNYSIFLHELILFAYMEYNPACEDRVASLKEQPVMKKWWAYMQPIMVCNQDNSPVVTVLPCVFHMD